MKKVPEVQKEKSKYNCDACKDTGFIEVIEWTGTDTSYPVTKRCNCNED